MKQILKSPMVNAVCISLFTAFYAFIFMTHTGNTDFGWLKYYDGESSFWAAWSGFLEAEHYVVIARILIAVTILVVLLLITRRRPYDEYQASI